MHLRSIAALSAMTALAAAVPASGQTASPAAGPANGAVQGAASIPDFSGIWGHLVFPDVEPPLSGPGPVRNLSRVSIEVASKLAPYNGSANAGAIPNGVSNVGELVGDFTNPILKPEAAEVVKQRGELEKKEDSATHAQQPVLARRRALRVLEHRHANAATAGQSHDSLRTRL